MTMKRKMLLAAACAAALWSAAAMALPSSTDVQAAVKAGDFPKAETMMQEVVAAKPQSAKAHYLYAEILAHDAKFADAAAQARKARELDPQLSFTTDPEKFRSFERLLEREQAGPTVATPVAPTNANTAPPAMRTQPPAPSSGVPGWVWVAGLAVIAFLIFRAVSRRAMATSMGGGGFAPQPAGYGVNPSMPQPGYGPGYAPGYGQAPGGGLLRTGLAAGAGVAGGMLLEKMLEGNRHEEDYGNNLGSQGGGFDSGSNQAASELENRPIDFGSGGNDWGGDAGGGGGSDNFSSGSDDGGGW
jgi:hypothetical protein